MVEHDPNAARATFVEICFGLNLLWAAFEGFRDLVKKLLTDRIKEELARIQTLESVNNDSHRKELESFKMQAACMNARHTECQESVLQRMKPFTIVATIFCILILYFDWLDFLGKWLGILLLPIMIYLAIAALICWKTSRKLKNMAKKFQDFVEQFPHVDVKADVESSLGAPPRNPPQS